MGKSTAGALRAGRAGCPFQQLYPEEKPVSWGDPVEQGHLSTQISERAKAIVSTSSRQPTVLI